MSSNINKWLRGSLDPENLFRTIQYKKDFRKEHPEYFDPDGIIVFCGGPGRGKDSFPCTIREAALCQVSGG